MTAHHRALARKMHCRFAHGQAPVALARDAIGCPHMIVAALDFPSITETGSLQGTHPTSRVGT